MNRTQLACYGLIASAFVLAGLIVFQTPAALESAAEAGLVVQQDDVTLITAQMPAKGNSEVLYVLDTRSEQLMVYLLNGSKKSIEPIATMNVADAFADATPPDPTRRR